MRFRSFQSRLLALFLGLFAVVLGLALLLVHAANAANARRQIDDALEVGAGVFHELVQNRARRLVEAARLLSSDFAFKRAYALQDRGTTLSALENHRDRIGADVMILSTLDYEVVADTLHPERSGDPLSFAGRIEEALDEERFEFSTLVVLDGVPYQMVVVPLRTPVPDAWISIGFQIGDRFADELRRLTLSDVSLLVREPDGGLSCFASTLPGPERTSLPGILDSTPWEPDRSTTLEVAGHTSVSLVTPLRGDAGGTPVVAVLQRSLQEALAPFLRLRRVLQALFAGGLVICAVLGTAVARSVSRPVLEIARRARRVEEGDYTQRLELRQRDEIGELASSFNHMVQGLQDRDRVRNLLGKVVSPQVAQELLRKEIELGGEEREVTILFSDVRSFTTLCEGASPRWVLSLLNAYLTRMTAVVERQEGVVDKYIGDALMALFGAPLGHPDDATRALETALGMCTELGALNAELERDGFPALRIGIGVNTARVVAGNMGSRTRLNYTVIGDGVNLASRLEGLTKRYGVPVVVSDATRRVVRGFQFRELDRVRVRGRRESVRIFEPLGRDADVPPDRRAAVEEYHRALGDYRRRDWDGAARRLRELAARDPATPLYRLYLERIAVLRESPPDARWDGTEVFTET